jgi:glutathione synthetase
MPQNQALSTLASGLAAAHSAYLEAIDSQGTNSVILFVVQDGERNVFDQRLIEYELLQRHHIQVERATFKQLENDISVSGPSRTLYYTSAFNSKRYQVSVVYFRAGYSPTDYPCEKEWQTRLKIEQSFAIKCPTVALQLAGAKKVQQVLSDPDELEYFVKDPSKGQVWSDENIALLRESFMPMYGMEANSKGIEIASNEESAKDYVMKPQREGGGNNVYREAIPTELAKLEKLDQERGFEGIKRREGYILMKLIQPPSNIGNYLLRSGSSTAGAVLAKDVISELGVFGTILFKEAKNGISKVVYEKSDGHLLRTKGRESDEGGVAVGYSVIDSPLLI